MSEPGRALNRFELTATLVGRDVLRYTPSGVPLIDCLLRHSSTLIEAGQERQVDLEAAAIAYEAVAHELARSHLDRTYRFSGFLANRSLRSRRTVFHITDFTDSTKG